MSENIRLRKVSMLDADLLLKWRNDPETRNASHNTKKVSQENHLEWLSKTLENPNRILYIAEENNVPVGTIRADFDNGTWELSWTTAPDARGKKVAKSMVKQIACMISDPIRAEIKINNIASLRTAEYAGMTFERESEGIAYYYRPAVKR